MAKRKKTGQTRFFTQIYDDILRSPDLTSHDVRLYGIMLSYCTKSGTHRVCKLTKAALAGEMKLSERTIYNSLRNLQRVGLIKIDLVDGDHRLPVYIIEDDPPIQCPEELRSNKLKDAITYIRSSGGVKGLQRKPYRKRGKPKRTGRPDTFTNGFTLEEPVDDRVDDPRTESTDEVSLIDSSTGSGLPVDQQPTASQLATHCQSTSNPLPVLLATHCQSTSNPLLPCTYKGREQVREEPNGSQGPRHMRALDPRAQRARLAPTDAKSLVPGCEPVPPTDINDDLEDDPRMAQPSKEEQEAARARQRALRKGTRTKIGDVSIPESGSRTSSGVTPQKARRGAGGPISKKDETKDVVDRHLTQDPDDVSEAPGKPWPLYWHFRDAVRKKFPDARLPDDPNGKYLKWGQQLLKDYSVSDLYEMVRVLVLDYENISASRIFFKFSGTPTPTYEQFFSNRDMLATFIGSGIVAPPTVRFSAYADDYNKRHGKSADITSDQTDAGKTEVDPLEELRDQVNG